MAYERIEEAVRGLGRGIANEAIVVGGGAIACALPGFREPKDVNIALPAEAFAYLQEQPDWKAVQNSDGETLLRKDSFDVGIGCGGNADYIGLQARSWTTSNGLCVANLADVYAYKQRRDTDTDAADRQYIQDYLQSPDRTPFSAGQIPHEFATAWNCLPAELQDSPEAERAALLAANGIHIVYTLYGHPDIGQANQIVGELERPEFAVPATYHNGFGLVRDAQALQRHLHNIGAPTHDRLLALAIDPYTDAIYGNGRLRDSPEGHDELRSANLLQGHALQLGFAEEVAERMRRVTLATTFDEKTKSQRGKHATDLLARAVAGVDLHPLVEPESVQSTFDLAVEDSFSARYNTARTIGKVLGKHGARVFSTLDGLRSIDHYTDERPADATDGPTVKEAFVARLNANAVFHRLHEYPDGWTLDNLRMREDHANTLERIAAELLVGKTTVEAYFEDIQTHTAHMRERYDKR